MREMQHLSFDMDVKCIFKAAGLLLQHFLLLPEHSWSQMNLIIRRTKAIMQFTRNINQYPLPKIFLENKIVTGRSDWDYFQHITNKKVYSLT